MAGRKPIEKRLMNIEEGLSNVMGKLREINPCKPKDDDVVVREES
jgi:hypothetical protein